MVSGKGLAPAIAGIGLVLCAQRAQAQVFSPVQCSACPTMTQVSWTYRVGGGTGVFELPSDPNCSATAGNPCPHYINNLSNGLYVSANHSVKQIDFRVDAFDTEACCDPLSISRAGLAGTTLLGTPATGWYPGANDGTSLEQKPTFVNFVSDFSITRPGFSIGAARVCCGAADNTPAILSQTTRFSGVLLGTGDTVYYHMFNLGANQHQSLALKGPAGMDFDVYVRCGALPTATQFDFRGFSADAMEYIDVPAYCASIYVAVNAFSGSGQYDLAMAFHSPSSHHAMTAGFDFAATQAQIAQFAATLQGAAQRFYGATEGQHVIDRIDLYTNQSCANCNGATCGICFHDTPGTGNSPICGASQMNVFQSYFGSPTGMAHEFGHRWFCLGDEYVNGSQWQCGHSIMANPFGDQHNFCNNDAMHTEHPRDALPGVTPTALAAAWSQAASAGAITSSVSGTPDNYNYAGFDFNGLAAVVVTH